MEDLKQALIIRRYYNRMDFLEFVKLLEDYIGEKIPQQEIDSFKGCGLNNIDFFTMRVGLTNVNTKPSFAVHVNMVCDNFEPTTDTSSSTICKNCGREKWAHRSRL